MDDHPTPAELEGFVWNQLTPERVSAVVSHLVRGCVECRTVVAQFFCALVGPGEPPEVPLTPEEDAAYDAALERAVAVALRAERDLFQDRKREALSLIFDADPECLPAIPAHLRGVPLIEALLERSWSLRHENPERMVRLAQWARLAAEGLDPQELGNEHIADHQCRAWIELGNAHRTADDLDQADQAMGRAVELLLQGTQDEVLAARLFDVQASLYGARRRFDLATAALDLVLAIHQRLGDEHLTGRALISKGVYAGYQGEAEEAVRLIGEGMRLVDANRDPRLVFVAAHNKARFLMDCGRFRDARIAVFDLKGRGLDPGGRVNELKVRWLEGQINAGLGELERAERDLREVQQEFEAMELGYKAALVGLELGAVLLRQGRSSEASEKVLAAADVFSVLGIGREAGASLLLLRKAFERKMTDAALLDYVIRLLHGLEDGPRKPEPSED
ncbi:MAG TPA: hypothetical protein VIW92_02720 [Thermoanaerobaculia bacterium]